MASRCRRKNRAEMTTVVKDVDIRRRDIWQDAAEQHEVGERMRSLDTIAIAKPLAIICRRKGGSVITSSHPDEERSYQDYGSR
jgi:hypothetical protein